MKIQIGETDDPYFIALVDLLVNRLVLGEPPEGLWIIQIDNWFDHKWLGFSRITFPPFTPNRVLLQWSFARVGDDYVEVPWRVPYGSENQPANLQRRVQDFSRSGYFVWYSGNTVANGRGSVMVYNVTADRVQCWFAAFVREQAWRLGATKGISRQDVEKLIRVSP